MTKPKYNQVRLDLSEESCVVLCKISPCRWRAVTLTAEQAAELATGHLVTDHTLTIDKVFIKIPQEKPEKVVAVKPVKVNPVKPPKDVVEKEPKPLRERKPRKPRPAQPKKFKKVDAIIETMENGPVTTQEIRDATGLHFRQVNSLINYLGNKGRVVRVAEATYALSTPVHSGV